MPFNFKGLPKEVRAMVSQLELELQFDNELPALLVALAPDKQLFKEALHLFKKINANVTEENEAEFKRKRMFELLHIKYLKLDSGPHSPGESPKPHLSLKAHKVQLRNNFSTIRIDCSLEETPPREMFCFLSGLVRASSSITKIMVRYRTTNPPGYDNNRRDAVYRLARDLHVTEVLQVVNGYNIWTFEAANGSMLEWFGSPLLRLTTAATGQT
ncbi:uncharacterized protein BP5553_08308 [Venustampulla echinocandica]|uniref:Uncharacterized protein n=1 Tax=Venustampulla echinocandica TaxID=2656787 RepID=A0A370TGB8_9HELO|nr:uncharacterized protein BP5553_08308 [Venustampulla echinocandica]RDL33940.1 hypothetical protein BP5553_08308 [Venustampulla echinocandica]